MNWFFRAILSVILIVFIASARDIFPNDTHAVLSVTFVNNEDVPQARKKLFFVGQNDPQKKVTVTTNSRGEATFYIPREETYNIFCETVTGPFACGETPYVSSSASTGDITVVFDDTRVELRGVTFRLKSAELDSAGYKILDAAIAGMKKNPNAMVEIQGHASSSEGDEFEVQKLSEERAFVVLQYMTSKGIDRGHLAASGYGASQPKASDATESGRRKNSRIELCVLRDEDGEEN